MAAQTQRLIAGTLEPFQTTTGIVSKMEVAFSVGWLDGFNGSRNDSGAYRPDLQEVYIEGFLEGQIAWDTRGV